MNFWVAKFWESSRQKSYKCYVVIKIVFPIIHQVCSCKAGGSDAQRSLSMCSQRQWRRRLRAGERLCSLGFGNVQRERDNAMSAFDILMRNTGSLSGQTIKTEHSIDTIWHSTIIYWVWLLFRLQNTFFLLRRDVSGSGWITTSAKQFPVLWEDTGRGTPAKDIFHNLATRMLFLLMIYAIYKALVEYLITINEAISCNL